MTEPTNSPLLQNADLAWTDSGLPSSVTYQDVYFSQDGGLAEREHVFLNGNKLAERWSAAVPFPRCFTIAELGFGCGLNFLLCWRLWAQINNANLSLHYIAYEKHPLSKASLQRILQKWPELGSYATHLLAEYPDHSAGVHRLRLTRGVTLDLHYGDATEQLQLRHSSSSNGIHCWFMDGFAPDRNPLLWSEELTQLMALHSADGATLSSYSVAGFVRRNLQQAGFLPIKVPGYGRKREMLTASLSPRCNSPAMSDVIAKNMRSTTAPWFVFDEHSYQGNTAVVIGAGLAGCATARSLAERGWSITVIEAGPGSACGASGNPQAVLQCRLASNALPTTQFFLQAYLYASRQFADYTRQGKLDWHNCGVLRIHNEGSNLVFDSAVDAERFYSNEVLRFCSKDEASAIAAVGLTSGGFFLPHGGWLDPRQLCQTYLTHANIKTLYSQEVTALHRDDERWLLKTASGSSISADAVVIANGMGALGLSQSQDYPLIPIRGQLSGLAASSETRKLRSVVAGARYICPDYHDIHSIGASYQAQDQDCELREHDDRGNLTGLLKALAEPLVNENTLPQSRASIRCNSRDQIPLIGPLPDRDAFARQYAELASNANATLTAPGVYWPGLFLNVAHGSYGLATCPLAAEILASLICGESLPVDTAVLNSLNPARFIIRELKRQGD